MTREERAAFLQNARVVSSHDIGKGITRPVRVTLSDGTTTHDAGFSAVDEHEAIMRFQSGRTELDFVDSYKYRSPPTARGAPRPRRHDARHRRARAQSPQGLAHWWVDDVKFDEGTALKLKASRRIRGVEPADVPDAVFTQLVADEDRNTENVLITSDWKLWMIDFTRAFRRNKQLIAPGDVTRCDRQLLEKLKALTKEQVAASTKPFIGGAEVDALMARRDAIVALIEKQVAARGEAQVLY